MQNILLSLSLFFIASFFCNHKEEREKNNTSFNRLDIDLKENNFVGTVMMINYDAKKEDKIILTCLTGTIII